MLGNYHNGFKFNCYSPILTQRCNIQKSIRINEETEKIINSMPGDNFSEKIRYMAFYMEKHFELFQEL